MIDVLHVEFDTLNIDALNSYCNCLMRLERQGSAMKSYHTLVTIIILSFWSHSAFHVLAKKSRSYQRSRKSSSSLDSGSNSSRQKKSIRFADQSFSARKNKKKREVKVKRQMIDIVRDKISGVQRKGYKYYLEIMAKGSSEFECACIKATRPNNEPPKEKYVSSIVAAVINFDEIVAEDKETEEFNPYRIALHKIWTRIANKHDWRIKLKALYVLHRLWSSVQIETSAILKKQMRVLSRRKCEKTKRPYFSLKDASATSSCNPRHSHYLFLQAYSKYVLFRCKTFSPSFEEAILSFQISSMNDRSEIGENSTKNLIEQDQHLLDILGKLKYALAIILSYSIVDAKSTGDDITASCFTLLKADLQNMYLLYEERLADLMDLKVFECTRRTDLRKETITSPQITEIVENSMEIDESTLNHIQFCEFYVEITDCIKQWVTRHDKIFRNFEYDCFEFNTEKKLRVSKVVDHIQLIKMSSSAKK
jgi:ANTH domain